MNTLKSPKPYTLNFNGKNLRNICLFFAIFSYFLISADLNAQAYSDDFSSRAITLNQINASTLSLKTPELHVTLDVHGEDVEPVTLELMYLQFDPASSNGQWLDSSIFPPDSEPAEMGVYSIPIEENIGTQTVTVSIPRNIIAKLKKHPAIILGKLEGSDGQFGNSLAVTPFVNNTGDIELIHVSALAFDNPMYSSGNMAPQIRETVKGIKVASALKPNVLSVVLADSYGVDNSKIYFVYNGAVIDTGSLFEGLPNHLGIISSSVIEYDMGNGDTLGGFLKWVNDFSQTARVSFSYYGHGSAIMPNIEAEVADSAAHDNQSSSGSGPVTMPSWVAVQPSWVAVQPSWVAVQPSWVAVQPSWVAVQPSWVAVQPTWTMAEEHFATDSNPVSLISVKDIARAVQVGTNDGEKPLAVLDLVHCFSLSVEQIYELAPYAESIVGSANYHFFDARMPGQALSDLSSASADSLILADEMMQSYDRTLPEFGYPRTMAVVDGREVQNIKAHWDRTSVELMEAFERNHADTRTKLQTAYQNVTKYDSTSCDNEFSLKSPDALVDFYELSIQIEQQFADNYALTQAAHLASAQIDAAIYSTVNSSGNPWFGTSSTDHWNFSGKGLSIFADLQGVPSSNSQAVALSWQSAFYNRQPTDIHSTPFDFLRSEDDSHTWADVIETSWNGYEVYPQSCLITIPPDYDEVDVSLTAVNLKSGKSGSRFMEADISIEAPLGNLIVLFEVVQDDEVIYSESIYTGWLEAGDHTIVSAGSLSKKLIEEAKRYQTNLRITLDPSGYLIESSTADNQIIQQMGR